MRVQKWLKIKQQLENQLLNQEVKDILLQLVNTNTTYFQMDELLDRLEFLTSILPSGKSQISIHVTYRMFELDHNYLQFLQLCNKYQIVPTEKSYWQSRGFENMEDFFLYKDFYIVPDYKVDKPQVLFWQLVQKASQLKNPSRFWFQLIKPYIYNVNLMNEFKSIYKNVQEKIRNKNPNLTKSEIDQIIYLGEDFTNQFVEKGGDHPIPLPENDIIEFEGIDLKPKDKYQQVYEIQKLVDQGVTPSMISKSKLFYRM